VQTSLLLHYLQDFPKHNFPQQADARKSACNLHPVGLIDKEHLSLILVNLSNTSDGILQLFSREKRCYQGIKPWTSGYALSSLGVTASQQPSLYIKTSVGQVPDLEG
jgi:hypothetical protein